MAQDDENIERLKEILDIDEIPFSIEQIRSLFLLCNKGRSSSAKYGRKKTFLRAGKHRIMEFCCCPKPYFYFNRMRSSGIQIEHKCDCCKLFIQCENCYNENQWINMCGKNVCIDCSEKYDFIEKRYRDRAHYAVVRKDGGKLYTWICLEP